MPLDPWERWLVIHAGELMANGWPRFRQVLVMVARQNGKTTLLMILSLYWMFVEAQPMILGTSNKLEYAKEPWAKAVELAENTPALRRLMPGGRANGITRGNSGVQFQTRQYRDPETRETVPVSRYKVGAANDNAGRSLTINRLVMDELRQLINFDAWSAASNACNAVMDAQIFCISNQGDDNAVVLDSLRTPAVAFIETGAGNPRLGIFEWSAPAGTAPDDVIGLAMANPNFNRRLDGEALVQDGIAARDAEDPRKLAKFLTEVMCMRVRTLNPGVNPTHWAACHPVGHVAPDLAPFRRRVALCLDVALDGSHATLVAAALLDDGLVHVEVVESWDGKGCLAAVRVDLPRLVAKIKPAVIGWFPNGPAAGLAADLAAKRKPGAPAWPPPGVKLEPIVADVVPACMGLATLVEAHGLRHPDDDLLNIHMSTAQKLYRGKEQWLFTRVGKTPISGAYATAGAVHLARTMKQRFGFGAA